MSVFKTKTSDPQARLSSVALLVVAILVIGLSVSGASWTKSRTAAIVDAVTALPSPEPTEGVLASPQPVDWSGYVRRSFVGGQGLEIVGQDAPGGVFQAYMPDGVAPVASGSVRVRGLWEGYTCAYGGNNGRCVPEVLIQGMERLPIAPE
jgi:hypothetical protein